MSIAFNSLKKVTFAVGLFQVRGIATEARDMGEAVSRAKGFLDRRAERAGQEAPVGWTLLLKEVKDL